MISDSFQGFTKAPRARKRVKDILPDDVSVEASSASDAEDSDPAAAPVVRGKRPRKKAKAKKADGWVWQEAWASGKPIADEKLAEYKCESKSSP